MTNQETAIQVFLENTKVALIETPPFMKGYRWISTTYITSVSWNLDNLLLSLLRKTKSYEKKNYDESWKLKSYIEKISEVVNNNLNDGLQSNVIDFNFNGKKYTSKSSLILILNE